MKAIMVGAGNIGRGFIGATLAQSGYAVTFIDISQEVVDYLNEKHSYPLRLVSNEEMKELEITGVDAIHGENSEEVATAISKTDLLAISVGTKALPIIAPNIAEGIKRRFKRTEAPLNLFLCENLVDVKQVMEALLKKYLNAEEQSLFDERIGLVTASIGRMVPIQTEKMQEGNPMRVCVEPYDALPVDGEAIKGEVPPINKLIPYSPFDFYLKRKLYVHNLGHAVCAYLGMFEGKTFIDEAIEEPIIYQMTRMAMMESGRALALAFDVSREEILRNIDDLLQRFANRALGDTCARVGGDPGRKLAPKDRLIGAAVFCESHGVSYDGIAVGVAAAIYHYIGEKEEIQRDENARQILQELCQTEQECCLEEKVMKFYAMLRRGFRLYEVHQRVLG